jgi:hypothetical protein
MSTYEHGMAAQLKSIRCDASDYSSSLRIETDMITPNPGLVSQENSVGWWLPDRVIYVSIQEDVTPSTADWRLHQVLGLIHSCPTPHVHIIIDVKAGRSLPNVFHPVSRRLIAQPRRGWVMAITDYPAWQRNLLNVFTHLTYLRYDFCPTQQAALETLQQHDSSLPPLTALEAKRY